MKFAEINAAYEIVGDEAKRKAFDRGEIDAEGKPRFQGLKARSRRRRIWARRTRRQHAFEFGFGRSGGTPFGRFGRLKQFEDILGSVSEIGRGRRGAGPDFGAHFPGEDFGSASGRTWRAEMTITSTKRRPERNGACNCRTARISKSTFRRLAEGQQIRLKGQGLQAKAAARRVI